MTRVLIVEDNEDLRKLLVNVLVCLGYEARGASSAGAGLQSLLARDVDVVITDWMLGDATGGSMLEQADRAGALAEVGVIIHSSSIAACAPGPLGHAVLVPKSSGLENLLAAIARLRPDASIAEVTALRSPLQRKRPEQGAPVFAAGRVARD